MYVYVCTFVSPIPVGKAHVLVCVRKVYRLHLCTGGKAYVICADKFLLCICECVCICENEYRTSQLERRVCLRVYEKVHKCMCVLVVMYVTVSTQNATSSSKSTQSKNLRFLGFLRCKFNLRFLIYFEFVPRNLSFSIRCTSGV